MSRPSRIIYEGAIYHIYNRANNGEYIFENDEIKIFILKYLKEYSKRFDCEILAYVIMNNHYHLLIKTNKSPINEIMFYINNVLGKYINTKLQRTGHVFGDRYKAILVENDAYLIWLLRYLHRNPVKAKICSRVEDYTWSSHYFYVHSISSFVNTELILKMLGDHKNSAKECYLNLVNSAGHENDKAKDFDIIKKIFKLEDTDTDTDLEYQNKNHNVFVKPIRKPLDKLIAELNISEDTIQKIENGKRTRSLTLIKIEIISKSMEEGYTIKEIANHLNIGPSGISKLISRKEIL